MKVIDKINKVLNTDPRPFFFILYEANSCPAFPTKSILSSFSNCLSKKLLPYDYSNTVVMVESGGLAVEKPVDEKDCIKKQMRIKPDLVFSLDIPVKVLRSEKNVKSIHACPNCGSKIITTKLTATCRKCNWTNPDLVGVKDQKGLSAISPEEKKKCIDKTIENAKYIMQSKDKIQADYEHEFEPVAVIQAFTGEDKSTSLGSMEYCTEALYSLGYDFFAFGGVSVNAGSRLSKIPSIVEDFYTIRDIIGKKCWVHALGITDVRILKVIKDYITSFDSAYITIQAKNAALVRTDDRQISVGTKLTRDIEANKYVKLYKQNLAGEKILDYKELQLINFTNYIEKLKRFVWN